MSWMWMIKNILCCAEKACDMCLWQFSLSHDLWSQTVEVDHGIYIHMDRLLGCCLHGDHYFDCKTVPTFLHGRPLSYAKRICGH